ncbi:MAG: radical SAM family heme chaperone HemW [Anaerolineaceae bacterium]|nr:radical SAM family heme chaperone HemW [Anaerolineaceae bacterium]
MEDYIEAICYEIESLSRSSSERITAKSLYIGGGTPSLINVKSMERLFQILRKWIDFTSDIEITIEANPGTVSLSGLQNLHVLGINRLSLGMQSANKEELSLLGRQHSYNDVIQAMDWAIEAGFDNINLDLIYGIPRQSLNSWKQSLEHAIELNPEHLSTYALTLENDVPMEQWIKSRQIPAQDDDLMADMYEHAIARLDEVEYCQYEISNWAKTDRGKDLLSCQHNLQYWHNLPYLGLGAGAHGFARGVRTENVKGIGAYIRRCFSAEAQVFPLGPAVLNYSSIDPWIEMQETLMVGLRLTQEGISRSSFCKRFGVELFTVFGTEFDRLFSLGLLEYADDSKDRIILTRNARSIGNQVFIEFVGKDPPRENR